MTAEDTAFLNFLPVKSEFRGQGIASRLLDEMIQRSLNYRLEVIRLETYSCLKAARKLYNKFGFSKYHSNGSISKYGQVFELEFWEKTLSP